MDTPFTGSKLLERLLLVSLVVQTTLFCWSLFGHISYPLFWNDEGMTVVGSQRVLEHGYPLAWDGKNMFYDLRHPDKHLGLDAGSGAYIGGSGWGHYYFGAVPVWLADNLFEGNYTKTGFIRWWFALAGLAGLVLFMRMITRAFTTKRERLLALNLFALLTLLSIPLVLHLREARYYSLSVLLSAGIMGMYFLHRFIQPIKLWKYTIGMFAMLAAMLFTFSPCYPTFFGAIAIAECVLWLQKWITRTEGKTKLASSAFLPASKDALWGILPLLLSLAVLFPYLSFFNTAEINRRLLENNTSLGFYTGYWENLGAIIDYFFRFEPAWLALGLKVFIAVFRSRIRTTIPEKKFQTKLTLSRWITLCLVLHAIFSAGVPNNIYIRYFVPMIPMVFASIAVDTLIVWRFVSDKMYRKFTRPSFFAAFGVGLVLPTVGNSNYLSGHLYELFHHNKGHLDYLVPFLQKKYENKDDLVIAANYEETCYMYYLDAKVIVGYTQVNMNDDLHYVPDAICFNPFWMYGLDSEAIERFQEKATYGSLPMAVRWYRVNNIPEVNYQHELEHQFKSRAISEEELKTKKIKYQVHLYLNIGPPKADSTRFDASASPDSIP